MGKETDGWYNNSPKRWMTINSSDRGEGKGGKKRSRDAPNQIELPLESLVAVLRLDSELESSIVRWLETDTEAP